MKQQPVWCMVLALAAASVPATAATTEYFVAPGGSNTYSGSREKPFATLERARDAVRGARRAAGESAAPMTVTLRGGSYRVGRTLVLGPEDSGTPRAPVVWRAAPGESVRLVGGVRLTGFRSVTDAAVLARLAPEVRHDGAWQRVFESPVLKAGSTPLAVDVDLAGADRLRLMVTDGGAGISWDHAVWADATVR